MFSYVNKQLAAGRVFGSEAELKKYLNSLRGYLARKANKEGKPLPRMLAANEAKILKRFRDGKLVAPKVKDVAAE